MSSVDVSVVIVNWNTRDMLRECLRSIQEQTTVTSAEIVVVDNASHDASADMVRSEFPQATLIANAENRGFAAANNQGIRMAKGRYVLLLNPDTIVLDGAIDRMVKYLDEHPDVGCAGCQVLTDLDTIQMTCFRFPSPVNICLGAVGLHRLFPKSEFFGRYMMGSWDRRSERDVDVVSGMFMLVRREAIDAAGLMDEAYFVYAEEADWCYRFHLAGWRCVFAPVARIIHRDGGGKSTSQVSEKMYVQQHKSLLIFHRKHYGRLAWAEVKMLFAAAMVVRYAFWTARVLGRRTPVAVNKAACALAALRYHVCGVEPV